MGATVSVASAAGAFQSHGNTYYVLWEQTYEKNCYPHTPRWCCIYIGRQADVIKRVFQYASDCEGGMLQNRSGHITPEGYLQRWLTALKQPLRLHESETFSLSYGQGFYDVIRTDRPELLGGLRSQGLAEIAEGLASGKHYHLPLCEHGELVSQLCAAGVSAWRLRPDDKPRGEPDGSLAVDYANPSAARYLPPIPFMARIDEHVFIEGDDGVFRNEGWDYSVVASFVANFWKTELEHPESYKSAIKTYRQAVKNAPRAEELGLLIHIDDQVSLKYGASNRTHLLDALEGRTDLPVHEALAILGGPNRYQLGSGSQYVTLRRSTPALLPIGGETMPLFA